MSKLYIFSTPIGNLRDLSLRIVDLLSEMNCLFCEDTRKTGTLLKHLNINPPKLISLYEENEVNNINNYLQIIQQNDKSGLICNSGTPLISDPGYKLIKKCLENNIEIEHLPGPSALISGLVLSGLPNDHFLFLGFPPSKPGKRINFFKKYQNYTGTIIFYESPFRIKSCLIDLFRLWGDIDVSVSRELTKIHEQTIRGRLSEIILNKAFLNPKGEFTVVFHK